LEEPLEEPTIPLKDFIEVKQRSENFAILNENLKEELSLRDATIEQQSMEINELQNKMKALEIKFELMSQRSVRDSAVHKTENEHLC